MAQVLTSSEIEDKLDQLADWHEVDNKLCARFKFADFQTAMAFITMVAMKAEKLNHHPEWSNSWNVVEFVLCTHDDGDQITALDFQLASQISEAASTVGK